MVEISNRLSVWRRWFQTPWFIIHSPTISTTSYIETLLVTHGYQVSVMDIPIPMKDDYPNQIYYQWAESCPFVKQKETLIQEYHSTW